MVILLYMEKYKIYIDGAAKGNPGPGGIGIVCRDSSNNVKFKISKGIGKVTNNQAEYLALIEALKKAIEDGLEDITIFSDSSIIVNQVNDLYKVKNQFLYGYYSEAKELMTKVKEIEIKLISRTENKEADVLASNAVVGQQL